MLINKKIIACLLASMLIGTVIPTARAQAFSFGDIQNQITSIGQKISQLAESISQLWQKPAGAPHCGDGKTQCVYPNTDNTDTVTNSTNNQTSPSQFNPEKVSIAGCKNEGEVVDAKNQKCCAGLQALKVVKLGNGTACSNEISGYVCAKCGDGICGIGENKCNCSNDCGKDVDESPVSMNCDQACKALGYQSSYCAKFTWKQDGSNQDAFMPNPTNYCASTDDDPMQSNNLRDTNCTNMGDAQKNTAGKQCCCKGKPQNSASCQQALGGNNTSCGSGKSVCDCISDTGWLKNKKTGECCWHNGCTGGQDEWTFHKTLSDCQNPCEFDKNKLACCRNGICNAVTLKCGAANGLDTDWIACDDQCKPVASCKPKTDIWDSCDKLCQKNNLGKVADCIANAGRSIINPENGYGCCCEKTVCAGEGEKLSSTIGAVQYCCEGLKQISVTSLNGIDTLCVNPANQKAGSICDFDDDCASGLKCKALNIVSGIAQSFCVDMSKQKEGAACGTNDDCATGFTCETDMTTGKRICMSASSAANNAAFNSNQRNGDKFQCKAYTCGGSISSVEISDAVWVDYCDGAEKARITCAAGQGATTITNSNGYQLCCVAH